jgi:hypothetical protein
MKILICSDGTSSAQTAIDLADCWPDRSQPRPRFWESQKDRKTSSPFAKRLIRRGNRSATRRIADIVVQFGEPVLQIVQQTSKSKYDLVVIGARWTGAVGHYWRSKRTYEVIKAIQPPVLVAIGERKELKRFVVCTGGKEFIEQAVQIHWQARRGRRAHP